MNTQDFSPEQYKQRQRDEWNEGAGGWPKWWQNLEQSLKPVSEAMIELTALKPGQRVLDIDTGLGEPALTAAHIVGSSGKVVATDLAPEMLKFATQRATAAGLHNIEFHVMDAEALDFPEASFDAIICRFALMFLPNLHEALQGMLRLLVPGGHIWAAVWGAASRVPTISVPVGLLMRELQVTLPPPPAPGPFSLGDPARLAQVLTEAGFSAVRTSQLTITQEWPSANDAFQQVHDVAGPVKAMFATLTPERQSQLRQMIATAMQPFTQPDGQVITHDEVVVVVGQRPQ